jgi:hypothetical protein
MTSKESVGGWKNWKKVNPRGLNTEIGTQLKAIHPYKLLVTARKQAIHQLTGCLHPSHSSPRTHRSAWKANGIKSIKAHTSKTSKTLKSKGPKTVE